MNRSGLDRMDRDAWGLWLSALIPLALMQPWMVAVFLVPFSLLLLFGARKRPLTEQPATWATAICGIASLAHYTMTGDSVMAFTGFFVAAGAVAMFQSGGVRSLQRVYLLGFLIMVVVSTRTLELEFLLFLLAFSVSLVMVWLKRSHREIGVGPKRWRYLAGATLFTLVTFVISAPLFLVLPRASFVLFNAIDLPSLTGFGDEVTLGEMASIKKSEKLFMRVFAPTARRWRGKVLEVYNGRTWRAGQGRGPVVQGRGEEPARLPRSDEPDLKDCLMQEFVIEPYLNRSLFAAADPVAVQMTGFHMFITAGSCLNRGGDLRYQKVTYRVWSSGPEPSAQALKEARGPMNVQYSMRPYLQIPPNLDRLKALATSLTEPLDSWHDKARALEAHLQENYSYTLNLPAVRSGDPVEAFLFVNKRGHCEYFASAMTLMLRSLGIPARMVTGFAFGEYNQYGKYHTVREKDAHAWTEAFMPGIGWMEFDPTPASDETEELGFFGRLGLMDSQLWLQMRAWLDAMDMSWQRDVVSYSAEGQQRYLAKILDSAVDAYYRLRRWIADTRAWVRNHRPGLLTTLAALLLASLAGGRKKVRAWLATLTAGYRSWKLQRRHRSVPLQKAPFYGKMLSLLEGQELHRRQDWTPVEFADRVAELRPDLAGPVRSLTELYCQVLFAGVSTGDQERERAAGDLERLRVLLRPGNSPPAAGRQD